MRFVLVTAVIVLTLLFGCTSTPNPNEKAYNITAKDIILQASDVGYGYELAVA